MKAITNILMLSTLLFNPCLASEILRFVPYEVGIKDFGKVEVVGASWKGNKKDWIATFKAINNTGVVICTATLVGPSTLLTAAHCVTGYKTLQLIPNYVDLPIGLRCKIPDNYENGSNDYALCKLNEPLDIDLYESISIQENDQYIEKGKKILLAGFGCRIPQEQDRFWLGYTIVDRMPGELKNSLHINFFTTRGGKDDAGTSLSDSGGCAYHVNGTGRNIGSRVCVAIASHKMIGEDCGPSATSSLLSSLSSVDGYEFITKWEKNKEFGAAICGVTPGVKKCRN